jgi:hypothetical protein
MLQEECDSGDDADEDPRQDPDGGQRTPVNLSFYVSTPASIATAVSWRVGIPNSSTHQPESRIAIRGAGTGAGLRFDRW